jgi:4-hydroxy-tetrahydrodipicolinate synthase/2-dehydro-3-deoxy-phosphogluconate/2-dehydro-3-deoxy-6-phosphogalactonate aldolase
VFAGRDALKAGEGYMSGVKPALELRGFAAGDLRRPLRAMIDAEREELRRELEGLDLL